MVNINNGITRAEQLIAKNQALNTRSSNIIKKQASFLGVPEVTSQMARSVSKERREIMEMQLESGELREQGSSGFSASNKNPDKIQMIQTQAGIVSHSGKNLYKLGTNSGSVASSGSGWRGSNDSARQVPDVYSPIWLNSNLSLPRDRPTINAWSRSFFALNPIVHNAISLHSTYPIAKLNIKSKNLKVEKFFSQMIEEIDLMNIAVLAAQEYWILGEAFIYAELDESMGKWSRLMILNPDYVNVQRNVIAAEPIISLRPDENLRRVVHGNLPSDLQQRKQLDPSIIDHVRKNENIPLNNFYVHHMARRISPYEIRGTGLVVSCFRALMLWDKLRECYGTKHEVLTQDGWKKIFDIIEINHDNFNPDRLKTVGVDYDENGNVHGTITLKKGVKVAQFNPETEEIEFVEPEELHMSRYQGKMLHFSGKKVDSLITPNHKMWVKKQNTKKTGPKFGDWHKIPAQEMLESKTWWKFRSTVKWTGKKIETVELCNKNVSADLYLEYLGYVVSEGCVFRTDNKKRYDNSVSISQLTQNNKHDKFKTVSVLIANAIEKNIFEEVKVAGSGYSSKNPKEKWIGRISGRDLTQHFFDNIGDGESANSHNKHLPRWVMELCPEQLQILLNALLAGDGSINESKYGTKSKNFVYNTVSKQLADDVYEIVLKCGYSPNLNIHTSKKSDGRVVTEYRVLWSDTDYGNEPNVYTGKKKEGNGGGASVTEEDYDGIVWCLGMPSGLFPTRHNGKFTILGNSKYAQADNMVNPLTMVKIGNQDFRPTPVDLEHWRNVFEEAQNDKDYKIFCHDAVTVERIGYGQGIYDTSADVQQLIKEIYIGLMVPSVIMDGSDTTYATGSIALDVLRQRYMQFRQMMTSWLKRKIFAPISQINDFYEYVDGEKTLIVPEVDWNHMSLFDMDSYVNNMINLSQGEGAQKRGSIQTLYRSLGLEYEEERRKLRYEDIQDAIRSREIAAMQRYSLHELKSLSPGDEIDEVADEPVPGQSPYENPTNESASGSPSLPGVHPMPGGKPSGAPPSAPIGSGKSSLPPL